jgi:putative ABC transport system permease protein
MLKVSLRGIWDHKRRLVLTIVSIVLGVSFMAGTFVLNDSFDRLFDDLFEVGNRPTPSTSWLRSTGCAKPSPS